MMIVRVIPDEKGGGASGKPIPSEISVSEESKKAAAFHLGQGRRWAKMEAWAYSIGEFRQSLRFDPTNAWGFCEYSNALRKLQRYDLAVEAANRAIQIGGDGRLLGAAYYNLGYSLEALGDKEKAIAAYEESLKARPGHMTVISKLREHKGQ